MEFNEEANLVERLICPSSIDEKKLSEAQQLAETIIDKLGMTGILAVELFMDSQGELLVNEVAPRTHNSGHHTIESCNDFARDRKRLPRIPRHDLMVM